MTYETSPEQLGQGGMSGHGSPQLGALLDQLHRNWDRGDNAANDDLVLLIREQIRRHHAGE